jgi:redox-sensing transcriptional repressor
MSKAKVSNAIIRRLPRYRRYLGQLKLKSIKKISSGELSELIGYTASQIRQDLNTFGEFGQQGYGYSVENLYKEISNILGLNKEYKTVIVGYGRLGQAMASYIDKNEKQFRIAGIFDVSDKVVSEVFKNAQVYAFNDLKEFVADNDIEIAVITVPREKGQVVADTLVEAGIKGIWNFSSVDLELPDNVCVENVHMSDSLHALAYYMKDK